MDLIIKIRKCIWCSKDETKTSFQKLAHTISQSLGGKNICKNVCDDCNSYFGRYMDMLPPIETVLKETFNISRARFLESKNEIGKNKALPKFSSIYFKVDFKNRKIAIKDKYKFHSAFQEKVSRQLKRGIYKVYLEELERKEECAHDKKYDFIREYSRYNLGDYPVIYFLRNHGIIMSCDEWTTNSEICTKEEFKYLLEESSFFEFELLGHAFGIATSKYWKISFNEYIKKSMNVKANIFKGYKFVSNFNDIDLTLSILNDPK
ncbi:MAG: HNH endonuclease [Chitinophagales bacterium]